MVEVQDIFKDYADEYAKKYNVSIYQKKVIDAVINCRTSHYGANVKVCEECGVLHITYNSCRNRHCPKCQSVAKEIWLDKRREELLNVPYFHVVFTVPHELNQTIYADKRKMYKLMFDCASDTVKELSEDKKYLGGQIGILAILHTWGQNLMFHPHIHMIIPAGCLTTLNKWRDSKKKFFLPVKVMSSLLRGKFMSTVKKMLPQQLVDELYAKDWVVYCKEPFKSSKNVLDYLGRYSHRVAISNNRILDLKDGNVTFKWRDYKDNNKNKVMTITAVEFIRRFLLNVLPTGFYKIRHYGFLGNRNKSTKLVLCQKLTDSKIRPSVRMKKTVAEIMLSLTGKDIALCKACGSNQVSAYSLYVGENTS